MFYSEYRCNCWISPSFYMAYHPMGFQPDCLSCYGTGDPAFPEEDFVDYQPKRGFYLEFKT